MDTIDRILKLQEERKISSKDLEAAADLANGSVTNWKKRRYSPGVDAIISLAKFFYVTSDYLLCLSDTPTHDGIEKSLTEEEALLVDAHRNANALGKLRIAQVCMNELDIAMKGKNTSAG